MEVKEVIKFNSEDIKLLKRQITCCPCDKCSQEAMSCCGCKEWFDWKKENDIYKEHKLDNIASKILRARILRGKIDEEKKKFQKILDEIPEQIRKYV